MGLAEVGLKLVTLGFVLCLVGMLLMAFSQLPGSSGAVVVFIGPIPVALGWGRAGPALVAVGAIVAAAMAVITLIMVLSARKAVEYGGRPSV